MLNNLKIHGYLGRDPELKEYTNSRGETGQFVKFSVGVSRDRDENQTDWFNVTMFGKRAAVIDKWFSKGSQIIVWGRMQSEKYTDRDGIERTGWTLMAEGFDFCDKSDSARGSNNKAAQGQPSDSWEQFDEDDPF